eukprot:TRINITY_DN27349_c0_g1_i1.p1 TRINITY_DN27349_c0_g1~~TRINITY_DN27349_c0_g1_i1.p1  ORF type:complete len:610 (-),score=127.06 TRINITY_DN27349_c0_g1_i1:170-1969(-)
MALASKTSGKDRSHGIRKTPLKRRHEEGAGGTRLFFQNVKFETTAGFLKGQFQKIGPVANLDLWKNDKGRSKGIGTVEFHSPADADEAMHRMQNADIDGRQIWVQPENLEASAWGQPNGSCDGHTLFFKNIPFETTAGYLMGFFKRVGHVVRVDLKRNSDGGSRGCGIVEYLTPEEAEEAVHVLNGVNVDGRPVVIEYVAPGASIHDLVHQDGTFERRENTSRSSEAAGRGDGSNRRLVEKGSGPRGKGHAGNGVFFKNLSAETSRGFLIKLFKQCGQVRSLDLWTGPDGQSKGMGVVTYASHEDAEEAIETLDGRVEVDGHILRVSVEDPAKTDGGKGKKNEGGKGRLDGDGGNGKGFGAANAMIPRKGEGVKGAEGKRKNRRVFFRNLLYETTAGILLGQFKKIGYVVSLDLWKNSEGRSLGMGVVEFETHAQAREAIDEFDGIILDGRPMLLEFEEPVKSDGGKGKGKKKGNAGDGYGVFFKNALFETSVGFLLRLFRECGEVKSVDLWTSSDGRSKGMGVVKFTSARDAGEAVDTLDGVEVDGRRLKVTFEDMTRAERIPNDNDSRVNSMATYNKRVPSAGKSRGRDKARRSSPY